MASIFELIEQIRRRPGMYTPNRSLADVSLILHGYAACAQMHRLPDHHTFQHDFSRWLHGRFGWSTNLGYAAALEENLPPGTAFDQFFDLVDEYRNSQRPRNE